MANFVKFLFTSLIGAVAMLTIVSTAYAEDRYVGEAVYINGGVGEDEANDIRAKAGDYNLRLYLTEGKSGYSVTDVPVTIIDKKGNVRLDIAHGGPMLFLQVEKGTYTMRAEHNGVTITKSVTVINHRGVNVYLNWKNAGVDLEDVQPEEF